MDAPIFMENPNDLIIWRGGGKKHLILGLEYSVLFEKHILQGRHAQVLYSEKGTTQSAVSAKGRRGHS